MNQDPDTDLVPRYSKDGQEVIYTAEAVEARQRHIITLLSGVRALGIALVLLFVVFGVAGASLLGSINETRTTAKKFARDQHIALCDIYDQIQRRPPEELTC